MSRSSKFFVFVAVLALGVVHQRDSHAEPSAVVTANGTVCPKCGMVHAAASPVAQTSFAAATSTSPMLSTAPRGSGNGAVNVLATLNAQRARSGVGQLGFDPQLQAVAERRAQMMASSGSKSHPPGSFSPGRYEGVGWSSSYSPSGVSACYTSDSRMRVAGAAMATGRDGVYFAVVYR
jgi:uncharacterized protein YkwD